MNWKKKKKHRTRTTTTAAEYVAPLGTIYIYTQMDDVNRYYFVNTTSGYDEMESYPSLNRQKLK